MHIRCDTYICLGVEVPHQEEFNLEDAEVQIVMLTIKAMAEVAPRLFLSRSISI